MAEALGLCLNKRNAGVSQYCGFNFNSMCEFNGEYIGASEDGIYKLSGDTDDGVDIDAYFELAHSDLGHSGYKRVRKLQFSYESKDDLTVYIFYDEDRRGPLTLTMTTYDRQARGEVYGERRWEGVHLGLRVENTNGCYFAVNKITGTLINLGRRKNR